MPSRSSIFNFDRSNPLLAIAIFAFLVVVLEAEFSFLPDNQLLQQFHAAGLPPRAPDWQIMGDSVARSGIVATQLSACLDNKFVFNAAIPATGPDFPYFTLKRELDAGLAPKAIIYAPSPHTFASRRVALLVGGYCTWPEIGEVLETRHEVTETVYGILCKISHTLRNREKIGGRFKSTVADEMQEEYGVSNPGTPLASPRHFTVAQILPALKKPFKVRNFNQVMLEKFLQLARDNHIPVYWVTMPVLPAVYEARKPYHFDEAFQAFLADLQKRYGIIVVQKEFVVLNDQDFHDSLHLNHPAAVNYTRYLGGKFAGLK
jgi:hypothetical protein